jgi:chromosome segregation ATPase
MAANTTYLSNSLLEIDDAAPTTLHEALNIIAGLDEQLRSLYRDREDSGGRSPDTLVATIEGLEAQLHSLYEERSSPGHLSAEVSMESLEAQLCTLYEEREGQEAEGALARFGSVPALARAASGFEEQLAALYEEHSTHRFAANDANHMVDSLELQVAALLEERDWLSSELEAVRMELQVHRAKARSLVAAVVDRALA